ncbi:putative F-box protein [Prunus yedoensis var. nudiflora]|uniref:Putative F-box protein n=1 Tax=Prunus yedoensis var. nudiflora TaxID=2094558 RepID=A0A314XJP0_PRUYE|nr:putative F-box protein [Prunus yedoensis var. nudiflora]
MASDWSGLPHHLLSSVFERLASPLDYLRSSIVCMSWHCMAKAHEKQFAKMQSCHRSPPLLLIPTGKNNIWKVYNVMDDKLLDLQVRVPNKRFCGSSKGGRKKEDSIIRLPQLNIPYCESWAEDCNNFVFKASISADPILNANECIVTVIYQDKCQVAFIRLGKDTTWTFVDERYQVIEEVAAIENKFYAVDHFTKLLSFDITT